MALSKDAELGKRLLDKPVSVTLLDGAEEIIYIHIEVQGQPQPEFSKRMFVYNYRIFDHFDRPGKIRRQKQAGTIAVSA